MLTTHNTSDLFAGILKICLKKYFCVGWSQGEEPKSIKGALRVCTAHCTCTVLLQSDFFCSSVPICIFLLKL